jgi:discoidin domain receptor family protein 2
MEARVFFSLDGERYQQTPLYFSLDTSGEDEWDHHPIPLKDRGGAARNVTIPLQSRVGRFVRLQLDFASKWILLSEVYFDAGKYSLLIELNSQI